MDSYEMIRDCNTCRHHTQQGGRHWRCVTCLPDRTLPKWEASVDALSRARSPMMFPRRSRTVTRIEGSDEEVTWPFALRAVGVFLAFAAAALFLEWVLSWTK